MFNYILFMELYLTPNCRSVDRLPICYEWVDGVQD